MNDQGLYLEYNLIFNQNLRNVIAKQFALRNVM